MMELALNMMLFPFVPPQQPNGHCFVIRDTKMYAISKMWSIINSLINCWRNSSDEVQHYVGHISVSSIKQYLLYLYNAIVSPVFCIWKGKECSAHAQYAANALSHFDAWTLINHHLRVQIMMMRLRSVCGFCMLTQNPQICLLVVDS